MAVRHQDVADVDHVVIALGPEHDLVVQALVAFAPPDPFIVVDRNPVIEEAPAGGVGEVIYPFAAHDLAGKTNNLGLRQALSFRLTDKGQDDLGLQGRNAALAFLFAAPIGELQAVATAFF